MILLLTYLKQYVSEISYGSNIDLTQALLENVNGLTEAAQNYLAKDDSEAVSVMNSLLYSTIV